MASAWLTSSRMLPAVLGTSSANVVNRIVLGLLIVLSFGAGLVKVMVNRTR